MAAPVLSEAATWRAIGASWGQLFGDFRRLGVSFEWHEFTPREHFDWSRSFHPESLEICLNLSGTAEVGPAGQAVRWGCLSGPAPPAVATCRRSWTGCVT
jgi:hypothetical protein